MKTSKLLEAQENAGDQVLSVFSFASDWSKEWRVFWTNHRTKLIKTKTIPGYFPHSIDNCSGIED